MAADLSNLFRATGTGMPPGVMAANSSGVPTSTADPGNPWNKLFHQFVYNSDTTIVPGVPSSQSDNKQWGGLGAAPKPTLSDAEKRARNEEAKAKKAGKAQSAKENKNTQDIIDTLFRSIEGYRSGYKTQRANADAIFKNALGSLDSQYGQTITDLKSTQNLNEQDEGTKNFAARSNLARERSSLMEQAALQGAGETDQLRAQVQAFNNLDSNLRDINTAYQDTRESINSAARQANITTETARNNAWGAKQEALTKAAEDYYANYTQVYTDIQRTAASNTNISSDYSTAFEANFHGKDVLHEASKAAGKTRKWQAPKDGWAGKWKGKQTKEMGRDLTSSSAAMTMTGPQRAEGVTLSRW